MNSATLPSFWEKYHILSRNTKNQAKKAYRLWSDNPFHPSLRFKCINRTVRVSLGYRALGVLDGDIVTWFWVGSHDDYEKFFR